MNNDSAANRARISETLKTHSLSFEERETRMSYGMIGHINRNNKTMILVFEQSFYVFEKDFSLNNTTLALIKDIQTEFEHLTIDANGSISPVVLGVDAM